MSEWKEKTLGEVVTFQRGHDLPQTQFNGGQYPIVGSNGIIGYHDQYTTEENGITIGRSGNIGNPFFIESKFWAHNTTLYVKKFHDSYPKFVYYLLKTISFQNLNSGSAVPSLNRNYIHPFPVTIPDYEEQKQIAAVLTSLDNKIENLRQQNQTLEQIAQTLFKHWFIDFEFPNDNGEPYKSSGGEMIPSELGDIPAGWRVGKLSDEFDILMGQSPPGSSYNEIKEGMIFFQGRTDFGFRFPATRLYTTERGSYASSPDYQEWVEKFAARDAVRELTKMANRIRDLLSDSA
ncbi:MAG: restriction endonuclease subunit S [Lyngbya sp.]|nr:restriction endonuclease subunit S [Lyngbya sp.]